MADRRQACQRAGRAFRAGMVLALGFGCASVAAQTQDPYGQNKVQYHPFHWSYYQTEHFDIYYAQGGELIAQFAARHVEELYRHVSEVVGHKLTERVPIILYNSHAEFEQTNVSMEPLDENTGGFTEEFKDRIVIPFEGSYPDFRHVLQHEMTHAVVFNMLYGGGAGEAAERQAAGQFPLWVNEGLAEYTSLGWDLESEFFMIDATTFGYVSPPITNFGGFMAYKGGQLFFYFMDSVYGKGTVTKFIHALAGHRDIREAFQKVTHMSLEEAGEIWLRELRYLYWPELGQRQYGKYEARKLTDHGQDQSFYNLQPSISPDGKEIAFFSDRESWEAIYILNVKTEKVTRAVVQSGREELHESFHSFRSGIAWSPDSRTLAVVSKQMGRDVINLLDAKNGHVRETLRPDVQAILSPSWSRDGRYLAFSGQNDGLTDIYVWDLRRQSLRRLTHDIADDDKPTFSPSGKWIAFESDRPGPMPDPHPEDPLAWYDSLHVYKDIYRISVAGDSLSLLAGGPWDEKMPSYGPTDSQLVFVSNRSGLDNIYLWQDSAGAQSVRPLTNLLTACFTPSFSYDGKDMAFSLFEDGGWDIYLMKDPLAHVMSKPLPKTRFIKFHEDSSAGFFQKPNWSNLSTYKPDTVAEDSVKNAEAKAVRDSLHRDSLAAHRDTAAAKIAKDTGLTHRDTAAQAAIHPRADSVGRAPQSDTNALAKTRPNDTTGQAAKKDTTVAAKKSAKPTPFLEDTAAYKDRLGNFISRPYKPIWSLDAFNAALGVDNYYGASGLAYLTLSDLMGDQSVSFALSMNGSIENTNGFIEYDYLPRKPDFDLMVFHQTQQFATSILADTSSALFAQAATDQQYGFGLGMRYPFSTFSRLEFELLTRFTKRTTQLLDSSGATDTAFHAPDTVVDAMLPSVAWVFDNAQWGIVGPVAGQRLMALVQYLPPVFQNRFSYVKAETDLRSYWEFFKRYTLAARISAGVSQEVGGYVNPQTFVVGGEAYTFNAHVNFDNADRVNLAEYYFSDLDFPLRGYDLYDFVGNRKFLANLEFRFPFVQELDIAWPLPLSIRYVMGSLFVDYGGAWSSGNAFDQMGMGLGWGLRLNLGIFVLKYSYAESVQGMAGRNSESQQYWSLGSEF